MTKNNSQIKVLKRILMSSCVAMGVSLPMTVVAQEEETKPEPRRLDNIIVTAEFKDENLQTAPITVSAVTGEAIAKGGIVDIQGIAQRVPGLTFSPFSPGQNIIALRGVSSNDDGAGTDNSVAVFVDDVYSGRVSTVNPTIFDLEAVEVLRGPQGTLRGKNTIGGAILYRTKKPNHDKFEAVLQGTLGNYQRREFEGMLTGPISENWAAKASFAIRKRDGWVDNRVLNKKQKDDDSQNFRGQLSYEGDSMGAIFRADYSELDVGDMARIPLTQLAGLAGNVDAYEAVCGTNFDPSCSANPSDGFAQRKSYGASANLDFNFGWADFASITAYREARAEWEMDSIGALFPLTDRIVDGTDQFTQEFRLSSGTDSFDWVVGTWYSNEKTDRLEIFDFLADRDFDMSDRYRQVNETDSYAIFGQIDWHLTDRLDLILGARYSVDEKDIVNEANAGDFVIINATFNNERSEKWDGFTPRFVLSYQLSDASNVYASFATGFKSGGFPAAPTNLAATEPLEPETAQNFEVGYKGDLLDDTLRLNLAAYYQKLKDIQYQSFGPLPGNTFGEFRSSNLEEARAYGFESEATWIITDGLTISGSYGYLNGKYEEAQIFNSNSDNQNGLDLIRAPRHKGSINANYIIPTSIGDFEANLSWRYTGEQRGDVDYQVVNGARIPYVFQPEFDLLDIRGSWTNPSDTLEISAWVRNAMDEDWVQHVYTIGGDVVGVYGDPRMYGITGKVSF